jgi:hypothetical protein
MSDRELFQDVLDRIHAHEATADEIEALGDACHELAAERRSDEEVFLP